MSVIVNMHSFSGEFVCFYPMERLELQSPEDGAQPLISQHCLQDGFVVRHFERRCEDTDNGSARPIYMVICFERSTALEYVRKYAVDGDKGSVILLSSDRLVSTSVLKKSVSRRVNPSSVFGISSDSSEDHCFDFRVGDFYAALSRDTGNQDTYSEEGQFYLDPDDIPEKEEDESFDKNLALDMVTFDSSMGLSFTCCPFKLDKDCPDSPRNLLYQLSSGVYSRDKVFILRALRKVNEGIFSLREFRSALAHGVYRDFSRMLFQGHVLQSGDSIVTMSMMNYVLLARELEGTDEVEYRLPYDDSAEDSFILIPAVRGKK